MIAGLPYDAEVEYLESTGTQYINTLVSLDSDDVVTLKGSLANRNSFFGVFRSDGTSFNLTGTGSNSMFRYGTYHPSTATSLNVPYVFECGNGDFSVDGNLVFNSSQSFTGVTNCTLFARNSAATTSSLQISDYLQGKIYWLQIKKAGVLVRDFIPVRLTNEIGQSEGAMYDRVSRKLFRNKGTGSFVIGPDVATPVIGLHFMKSSLWKNPYVTDGLVAMWDGKWNAGGGDA